VITTYNSNNNKKKIYSNRENIHLNIEEKLLALPLLKNDTSNVIEFNTGFNNENKKIKRNFWNLFKEND
tara:strand:+ start:1210 stop:1416 length:207 start_codon:yes stop_codon:yes gene_type:complete